MFIKTIRFNRKTAVLGVIAAAVIIIAVVLVVGNGKSAENHSIFDFSRGVQTNEGRVEFLRELGWEVAEEPLEVKNILIPKEFSDILKEYNELQLSSGFDLTDFAGLTVEQYTYKVTNYENASGEVNATIYIYNYQVIGGDIHSTAIDGFMHGLK